MGWTKTLLVLGAVALVPAVAGAQAPPSAVTPPPPTALPVADGHRNCAPTVPRDGAIAPKDQTIGQAHEPLGDRLARSDGVLCPPANIDPQMRAPPPGGGRTPVIPPPGSPGGDPSIRPK